MASSNSIWNNSANWSTSPFGPGGASVPGAADLAIFSSAFVFNCNLTTNITAQGILILSGYSGIISQASGITLTVGTNGFDQSSGSFLGSNGNIDVNGTFVLSGGTFTSTSATLSVGGTYTSSQSIFIINAGIFNHNNGTVEFDPFRNSCAATTYTVDILSNTQFYNLNLNGSQTCGQSANFSVGTNDSVEVINTFSHINGYLNGVWELKGDFNLNSSADGGLGTIIFNSSGAQTFSNSGAGRSAIFQISKPAGSLSPNGGTADLALQGVEIINGTFQSCPGTLSIGGTYNSSFTLFQHQGGSFDPNSGLVEFDPFRNTCAGTTYTLDLLSGTDFYDVLFNGSQSCGQSAIFNTSGGDTLNVLNDLTHADGYLLGIFEVKNDLIINSSSDGGLGEIIFNGAAGQEYNVSGAGIRSCKLTVDKSAGTVSPSVGTTDLYAQGFKLVNGTFQAPPNTFTIGGTFNSSLTIFEQSGGVFDANNGVVEFDPFRNTCAGTTYTIDVISSTQFYNVLINGSQSCGQSAIFNTAGADTIDISNDLSHNNGYINGIWEIKNDLNISSSADGGLGEIIFNGNGTQQYSLSGASLRSSKVTVDKPSGIVQAAVGTVDFSVQGFKLVNGTFQAPTGTMTIGGTFSSNSNTLFEQLGGVWDANGGALELDPFRNTCAGVTYIVDVLNSTEFYDFTVNGSQSCGQSAIFTSGSNDSINVTNNLSHFNGNISGIFEVKNNLLISSSSDGGLGEIIFNGTGNQEYDVSAPGLRSCFVVVDKPSGNVSPALGTIDFSVQGFKLVNGSFQAPSGTMTIGGTYVSNTNTLFEHVGGVWDSNGGEVELDPFRNTCAGVTYIVDVLQSTEFNNLTINGSQSCGQSAVFTTGTNDTVNTLNDFIHNNGYINGLWEVKNNLFITSSADGGLGQIIFNGSGLQEYSVSSPAIRTCELVIDKSAGSVSAAIGTTDLSSQGLIIANGTFQAPTGTLAIGGTFFNSKTIFRQTGGVFDPNNGLTEFDPFRNTCAGTTYTLEVLNSTQFYNLEINGSQGCGQSALFNVSANDTIETLNDFTHTNGYINGLWEVKNDLILQNSADGGLGQLIINGTGAQRYDVSSSTIRTCKVIVDKPAGIFSPEVGTTDFSVQGFILANGGFTAVSGVFSIGGTFSAGETIFEHRGGNFINNNGTVEFDPFRNSCAGTTYTIDVLPATGFSSLLFNGSQGCGQSANFNIALTDTLFINNDLFLNNGIVNSAPFLVSGNATVGASYDGGNSVLIFNGNANQNFDLSGASNRFNADIIINNNSTGVTLLSNCQLDAAGQEILFNIGNINSSGTELLIIGDGVLCNGVSSSSYVNGPVRKVGNDAFDFPTGKNGFYAPISISNPSVISDHFTAEYFDADPDPLYSASSLQVPIDSINRNEYWILDRTNGSSSVFVTMYFDINRNMIDTINNAVIARWDTGASQWQPLNVNAVGNTDTGMFTTVAPVNNFSPFTFASTPGVFVLPTTILNIGVTVQSNYNQIVWETLAKGEVEYHIEKTTNGEKIDLIHSYRVNGEGQGLKVYNYKDYEINKGTTYYRIREVDNEGNTHLSNWVNAEREDTNEVLIRVLGNPVLKNKLVLEIQNLNEETFIVSIVDLKGRIVYETGNHSDEIINNVLNLELNDIVSGKYVLLIKSPGINKSFNILID